MGVNLLVYYVTDIEQTKDFFCCLGLSFEEERHGSGPLHYSTNIGKLVFEIYPIGQSKQPSRLRLGLDLSCSGMIQEEQITFIQNHSLGIQKNPDGQFYAVIKDPNGNHIELCW